MIPCPPLETLARLGQDSLDPMQFAVIESHVAECNTCRETLEHLVVAETQEQAAHRVTADMQAVVPAIPGFVIERELGRGGMGVVYEAWQPAAARRVAIKVVGGGPSIGDSLRARWLREARAMGKIRHPNVVPLHQVDEHEGWLYLVLELMPGGSLKDQANGPLPPDVAARLVETAAGAVAEVHRAGLLHLDIKPSNILLDASPEAGWDNVTPKVADFDIARDGALAGEGGTLTLGAAGTPAFMAPEQLEGPRNAIGPEADVFALGATLYALLTGRPPFQAASPLETIDLLRSRDPAPPRSLVPGLPRDLETITLKCLQKDPARRYRSAVALADDLRRWREGYPIQARPVSKAEQAARWCRRHPSMAGMAAGLALIIVASLVGLYTLYRQSAAERDRANLALERSRKSEAAATDTIGTFVNMVDQGINLPHVNLAERMERASQSLLELMSKLRQTENLPTADVTAIVHLQRKLVPFLLRTRHLVQARQLLEDCASLLRDRRNGDPAVDREYALVLVNLALVDHRESRYAEMLARFQHVDSLLIPLVGKVDVLEPACIGYVYRRDQAVHPLLAVSREESRQMNEANLRLFEAIATAMPNEPVVRFILAVSRHELNGGPETLKKVWRTVGSVPDVEPAAWEAQAMVSDWVGRRILRDVEAEHASRRPDPDAFAEFLIQAMLSRIESEHIAPINAREIPVAIGLIAMNEMTAARRAERSEDARWMSDWLTAFAKKLVARDPRAAAPHLILARSYEYEQKLLWAAGRPDPAEIERLRRASLVEAWTALELAPDWDTARVALVGFQEKFIGFVVRPNVD